MTSDPAAPNAPAVYLFREETVTDDLHMHSVFARVKILTEKGKEMFGNIELPYETANFDITDIHGRTIHSDGTVIPFTGKPLEKLVVKSGGIRVMEKVFSLPDVQVGSIIEYRWQLRYDTDHFSSPEWYIQQPVFVHKAHYHFNPTKTGLTITHKEHGHEEVVSSLVYTSNLPGGVKVREGLDGYDLTIDNIAALPDEDYMPPFRSFSYRVIFYYSAWRTSDEYWKTQGRYWSKDVDRFVNTSGKIADAARQIVAPTDTDRQKVEKIYAAVMKIENTSFTRTHSAEENKAEGIKIKNAEDIWNQKRGTGDEINRLFIALVRASGLKAYGMIVVNRDRNVMQPFYLDWEQLDDEISIVPVTGKEMYFDPGQRYCEFGKLHWKHTWANGIRQTDNGTLMAATPALTYQDNHVDRLAELSLDQNGQVHGFIRMILTGTDALTWRQAALQDDETEVKKDFEEYLQRRVPPGTEVKVNHFVALSDYTSPLLIQIDVSGTLGTTTGKRVFLPAIFFEASTKPLFTEQKRENSIDLHYPYTVHDQLTLTLPAGMSVESIPKQDDIPFSPNADYVAKFTVKDNIYAYGRLFRLANPFYTAKEYTALRDYYQHTNSADQEQVVLKSSPTANVQPIQPGTGK